MKQSLILLFFLCIILGALGAWLMAWYGSFWRLMDRPNERSSHTRPIPRGGGIGILAAFFISCWVLGIPIGFWLPVGVISLLGLVGDRLEIRPRWRLLVQVGMAVWFLTAVTTEPGFFSGWLPQALLIVSLAIFVVGTANFYNFMDGIDGIAGLTGVVGFVLMGYVALSLDGKEQYDFLSFSMAAGCLGFLPFNLRGEAKVFMGDVGSILLGVTFAGLVVLISKSVLDFICFASFLFPFYADELVTMAIRIKDSEKLTLPHRKHLYQLLANERGISHWKVSAGYGAFQLLVGLSILFVNKYGLIPVIGLMAFYFTAFTVVSFGLRRQIEKR